MEDSSIVELYWQRDESAIRESEVKYGRLCRSLALNILGSKEDAEECLNDTWHRAWTAIPPARPPRLGLFLAKITRNLAFDRWRSQSAEKRGGSGTELLLSELADCLAGVEETEDRLMAKELEQALDRFLRSLKARERNVFLRRYFYGESARLIARRFGMTAGSVNVSLSRTRRKLKEFLDKEGF